MSARGFGSLFTAATVVGTALGCYMISLKVASERAQLEKVEAQIVQTQRSIRLLETEIGTRGRLAQLEKWNANFMQMSAPSADQILEGSFQLATMIAPPAKPAVEAPVVLAAATTDDEVIPESRAREESQNESARPDEMIVQAGLERAGSDEESDPLAPVEPSDDVDAEDAQGQ